MGKQKKRWTLDEESALIAGVRKYGMGKWRDILSDQLISQCLKDRSNVDLKDKWRNLCANVGYLTLVAEPYYHLQMEDKWQNLGDNVPVLPPDAKPDPRVVAASRPKVRRIWRIIMIITVIAIIGCVMKSHWKLLYLLPPIKMLWVEICDMTPAKLIKRWKDLRRSTRTACQYYKWLKKVAKHV